VRFCLRAAVLLVVACQGPKETPRDGGAAEPQALSLFDITELSPDLAKSPFGGQPGWDATDKYTPGVALADLDGDRVLDLVQPRNDRRDPARRALRMYRGLGDGRFTDLTRVEWDPRRNATVVLAFDYDADEDLDLFVGVDGGPSVLYRNDGDFAFVDVATQAGVDLPSVRVLAAAAGDVDRDGDLDLYAGAWNASASDHGAGTSPNFLFENQGDGSFRDVTQRAGVACGGHATLGVAFADLDLDGDQDLFVANDFFPACLYENLGDGSFLDRAEEAGVLEGAWNGMGVAVGDLDGDLDLDVVVTDDEVRDASRGNAVYLNRGTRPMSFHSRGTALGLDGVTTLQADWLVCWGVGLVDLDLDGDLDVHMATHGMRSELVYQNHHGAFVPAYDLMASLADVDARGSAYGDLDRDGDLDLVVARRGAPLQVLRNDTQGGAFVAVSPRPLRMAPGSLVTVTAGGRTTRSVVSAGSGYLSTSPPEVTIGLGVAASASQITVLFPDGTLRELKDVGAHQQVVVEH
jgi:hypothetical protein